MKRYKGILQDREDAALRLMDTIPMQKLKEERWKSVAVSKGGLALGALIAGKYNTPLEALFMAPIMAPNNPECEIARVSETQEIVIHETLVNAFEIQYDYIYGEAHRKHEEDILGYIYQYRKGRPFGSLKQETVLLVDDGSETGSRFMTALKSVLAQKPKAVYIAVPVLPTEVLELLEPFVDEIYHLYDLEDFVTTSFYYKDLKKVDDEEIETILEENR